MKKTKRIAPGPTSGASDAELIRWTKSHDVFDRLQTGVSEVEEDHSDLDEVLREAIFQDNTAQLNMRLPPAMKAVLSKVGRERTTDATSLARIWLAERLERELQAERSGKMLAVPDASALINQNSGLTLAPTGPWRRLAPTI